MIAICVGHSRRGDMGALSVDGVSEWHYNSDIAKRVRRKLEDLGHEVCVISKYPREGYSTAMEWLRDELAKMRAEAVIELHFNSNDFPTANGHEWLHWHSSPRGKALAKALQGRFANTFPTSRSRGLQSISTTQQRGGLFLLRTPCPAVIAEPFFGSNRGEWEIFNTERELYAEALALGIDDWKGGTK
jgi:N-acetylmuramoyl-L-alanine amidase